MYSRESGRSRGFGFVSFSSEEAMNKALKMDGLEMNGRKIQVLKKINRDDRDRRRDGGRRDRSRDGDYRRVRHYDDSNKLIVLRMTWIFCLRRTAVEVYKGRLGEIVRKVWDNRSLQCTTGWEK